MSGLFDTVAERAAQVARRRRDAGLPELVPARRSVSEFEPYRWACPNCDRSAFWFLQRPDAGRSPGYQIVCTNPNCALPVAVPA